ncbi:50S ribosomal protein L25/general stress protein Ctc [Cupriavidus sp. USMAA2-4]|uniref:Large ribosomal subunit protein bL25 n=1 Tax=Cupriavidus malaysiensis TaxID=367825 RepID=A0ABM6F0U6_9BURK|nr:MULTISPECIES: 50S ribosomal protein L25/general stress protein Ctc [Cupriavidus]AOY91864.1 50S ribosomal protein L25/general stress protein Ctc [Cupriavidus sp. USMAA2-4]AOY98577.1 50S ribosomal protein L25/general stress protein Ctc [Cupriavidus sp. USMAHM13]AOZ05007.1 50S ribosomal protein L25/general stress protein Ctc [Cupriavidus malaysiensis]
MKVVAFERSVQGTGASRRLRNSGKTPGIIYGGAAEPKMIELDHNALWHALKKEAFHSSILDLEVAGKSEKALLRAFQMHPFKPLVLHVDFQRVSATEKIHVKVPLHFINQESAPGVKLGHGIVNHIVNELEVSCLPADLPEFIEVDLGKAELNQTLHLSDITLPKGVTAVIHGDDNPSIASVTLPAGAASEAAEGGEEAPAA